MTVADWGSAGAPRGNSHNRHRQSKVSSSAFLHPAHGGATPRGRVPAHGYDAPQGYGDAAGYGAPHAYGTAPAPHPQPGLAPAAADDLSGLGRALNALGAVLSVALIVGLAIWGYKLAVRDVSGIPVVRALEGPMRVQPDDPGGVVAPHQGLAVNTVAGTGGSAGPADQVMLAPTPAALAPGDVPAHPETVVAAAPTLAVITDDIMITGEAGPIEAVSAGAAVIVPEVDADAAVAEALGLIADVADRVAPLSDDEANATAAAATSAEIIPASVPGVVRSPRPAPRPAGHLAAAAAAVAPAPAAAEPVADVETVAAFTGDEVAAGTVAAGTRLVQLGAYETTELARAEWQQVSARFPELFDGRDYVIEQAQSGGKTFYRLRTMGFDDLADARQFCAALMASNSACIPVVVQ